MHPFRLKTRGSTLSHILVDVVPADKEHGDIDIDEVLSSVVEKIKEEKELSVYQLLNHPGSEDILTRFVELLGSSSQITRSQALLVIASTCSFDVGRRRLTSLLLQHTQRAADSSESVFLDDITSFLSNHKDESLVVNDAMATLCTLASSLEGRRWLLAKDNFHFTIFEVCCLLATDDKELRGYASLLIARITAEEEGSARILNCRNPKKILLQIIGGLDIQEPSEQIAIALGQIMMTDVGRVHIMISKKFNQMVLRLIELVSNDDSECCWASCYALCSLAANTKGLLKILNTSTNTKEFIANLFRIVWKGIITEASRNATRLLCTLINAKEGWEIIRSIDPYGKKTKIAIDLYAADQLLVGEISLITAYLKSLPKPEKPTTQVLTSTSVHLEWKPLILKCNLPVTYCIQLNGNSLQCGTSCSFSINDLSPYTNYTITLQQMTDRDESQLSDKLFIKTKEAVPSSPRCFKAIGTTTSQLKLSWLIPKYPNGVINGYAIHCQGKNASVETSENYHIFSNLAPETMYTYEVCAFTSAGKGNTVTLPTKTASLSDFAPTNVTATIVGRSEILLQWDPPIQPLGRLNYYEATLNDQVIYSGIDRKCRLRQIKSGTEPIFRVSVWTSEGKCEAKPISKKLPKTNANVSSSHKTLPPKIKRIKKGKEHTTLNTNHHTAKNVSNHKAVSSRVTNKPSKMNTVTNNDPKSTSFFKPRSNCEDINIAKLHISKQSHPTTKSTMGSCRGPSSGNAIVRERPQCKTRHTIPLPVVPSRPIERPQMNQRLSIQNITLERL